MLSQHRYVNTYLDLHVLNYVQGNPGVITDVLVINYVQRESSWNHMEWESSWNHMERIKFRGIYDRGKQYTLAGSI